MARTQKPEDRIMILHYGELFSPREIIRASAEQARELGCKPGQPIIVVS